MSDRLVWKRGREDGDQQQTSASAASSDGSSAKMGWMYNAGTEIDQESYLTGKKVDKNFDNYLLAQQKNFENSLNPNKNGSAELDVGRKYHEDPLTKIKNREVEEFNKLKSNPQKMNRIKKLMNAYMGGENDSSSDDSEENGERNSKNNRNLTNRSRRENQRSRSRSPPRKSTSSHHRSHRDRTPEKRHHASSRDRKNGDTKSTEKLKKSPKRAPEAGYGLIVGEGYRKDEKRTTEKYESKFAPFKKVPHAYRRQKEQGFSNKMSAEEKAKRLAEMTGNAESHDKVREKRVRDGRKVEEKEDEKNNSKQNDYSYYRRLKMAGADKSLEERVKARVSSNQRTTNALDKNWTKR